MRGCCPAGLVPQKFTGQTTGSQNSNLCGWALCRWSFCIRSPEKGPLRELGLRSLERSPLILVLSVWKYLKLESGSDISQQRTIAVQALAGTARKRWRYLSFQYSREPSCQTMIMVIYFMSS